jgi:hypothetical protein
VPGFSEFDHSEAQRTIESALRKSEKALLKLKQGTFSHTLTMRGIAAYRIALELLKAKPEADGNAQVRSINHTKPELDDAIQFFESTIARVQKVLPKFAEGTPQHTLAVRRIRAFEIVEALIREHISH